MNLTAAPSFNLQSGAPYQQQRTISDSPIGSLYNYYYTQAGSSRLPTTYQLNFSLEALAKPFGSGSMWLIGGPVEIGVKAEVFNVTNQQQVVRNNSTSIQLAPGPNFGLPRTRTALQAPRAFRFTGLIRF